MSRKFEYSIVRLVDECRDERLNAALAVFTQNNLEVHFPKRLDKLKALSAALNVDDVKESALRLAELDELARGNGQLETQQRIFALKSLTYFDFSETSHFEAGSTSIYEAQIVQLLKTLVEPEPAPIRTIQKRTKLMSKFKSKLRSERILAKKGEDISNHRVVSNLGIAEGLTADFVLKNGSMHVIETVDAADETTSPRKVVVDVALSALVLEQARMSFGEANTNSLLVYEASAFAERIATPSLDAAAHQGTNLINWASETDRKSLMEELTRLAVPYEDLSKRQRVKIHGGVQHKFEIN